MSESKPWWLSAGVWGALTTLLASALSLFKIEVDPALLSDLQQWALSLAGLIGGAVALWGRLRASRRLRSPVSSGGATPLVALACFVGLSGCAVLQAPEGPYVAADRATYDAVAPEYGQYVAKDTALDTPERDRRLRTLDTWRLRLESAERTAAPRENPNDQQ